ncbi:MAG: phosphatidylglycerophosphatase A [Phycisphaerales bacterium]|nr:phosphatidylglycerophosphatase A [Phycisphaerales bacterium]
MNRPLAPLASNLVTTFALGMRRPASGTWGSLPPVALAALMLLAGWPAESLTFGLVMAAIVGLFGGACVRFGDEAGAAFGKSDPSQVVADETAGMALVLAFLPAGTTATPTLAIFTLLFAFVAFRVFDIFKPYPAYQLQNMPAGWGILLDDIAAAIYTILVMYLAAIVLPIT